MDNTQIDGVKDNNNEVASRIVSVLLLFVVAAVAAYAWFTMNQKTGSHAPEINAVPVSTFSTNLYEIEGDTETPIQKILIKDYIPGENRYYRAEIINLDNSRGYTLMLNLKGISADLTPNDSSDGYEGNLAMCDKLIIKDMSATDVQTRDATGDTFHTGIISTLVADENISEGETVNVAEGIQIPAGHTVNIYFTFKLDETADNSYQYMALYVNQIESILY